MLVDFCANLKCLIYFTFFSLQKGLVALTQPLDVFDDILKGNPHLVPIVNDAHMGLTLQFALNSLCRGNTLQNPALSLPNFASYFLFLQTKVLLRGGRALHLL